MSYDSFLCNLQLARLTMLSIKYSSGQIPDEYLTSQGQGGSPNAIVLHRAVPNYISDIRNLKARHLYLHLHCASDGHLSEY